MRSFSTAVVVASAVCLGFGLAFSGPMFGALRLPFGRAVAAEEPTLKTIASPLFREFGPNSLLVPGATTPELRRSWDYNTKTLRCDYEIRGVLSFGGKKGTPTEVLNAVKTVVGTATGSYNIEGIDPARDPFEARDIGTPKLQVNDGDTPTWSLFMYNWENRHGELHVWLFPYPNGDLGYAVHHTEEPLR